MGDAAVGGEYGKHGPPDTENPGAKFGHNEEPNTEDPVYLDIKNPHSQFLADTFSSVCLFFESYGWYIIFAVILYIVIWTNIRDSVYSIIYRLQKRSSDKELKDPQLVQSRLEAMERSRLKMQEKYELESKEKLEKIRQREEQKQMEAVRDHDALKAGKSQSSTLRRTESTITNDTNNSSSSNTSKQRKPLRQTDYNPLTGTSNSGPRYRPSSRRPTSGG